VAQKREEMDAVKAQLESDKIWAWNEQEKLRIKKDEANALSGIHLDQAVRRFNVICLLSKDI